MKGNTSLQEKKKKKGLTWYGLAVNEARDLPVEDAAPPAESFEELHLLLVNDVLHRFGVLPQLREGIALLRKSGRDERED